MALEIILSKSLAGASDSKLRTLTGLGLKKFGQKRLLKDTPAIRGMVFKVRHLVSHTQVAGEAPARKRQKPRAERIRAKARVQRESKEKAQ